MKKIIITILLAITWSNLFASWELNDVSYLFPLPESEQKNKLLKMSSSGIKGELMALSLMDKIPLLMPNTTYEEASKYLHVIAVRIDPCTPIKCQKQIRLVWQYLDFSTSKKISTIDVALHTFYDLENSEFDLLLADLIKWKNLSPQNLKNLPLQIHPNLKNQKLISFQKILLKYIGHQNMTRLTLMTLRGSQDIWSFFGYNIIDREKTELFEIPRVNRSSQVFFNYSKPYDFYPDGRISPEAEGRDSFNYIVSQAFREYDPDQSILKSEYKATYKIENPKFYHSESADCVSCHVSTIARSWIEKESGDFRKLAEEYIYKNTNHNLEKKYQDPINTHNLRSFGYYENRPSIGQRVINESAQAADYLNSKGISR